MMQGEPTPMGQALKATVRVCPACSQKLLSGDPETTQRLRDQWEVV